MKIHKVRKPFMCRPGQFEGGNTRSLCVGIKRAVLEQKDKHFVQLSQVIYEVDCKKALLLASEKHAFWKDVVIVPILLVGKKLNNQQELL